MDKTKNAYDLTKYDSVFVILKPGAEKHESYKGSVKYDKSRKKYFIPGRIPGLIGYPKPEKLPIVLEPIMEEFKKRKKAVEKQDLILNIHFSHIDFITLEFDSLDWK